MSLQPNFTIYIVILKALLSVGRGVTLNGRQPQQLVY